MTVRKNEVYKRELKEQKVSKTLRRFQWIYV